MSDIEKTILEKSFKSIAAICEQYGFSRNTVENLFKRGKLTKYQPDKLVFVDENEVKLYIESGKKVTV